MSEREYSERPWGNYTVLDRRRPRPQGQAPRRPPGQAAQLPAPPQAGRALVHRGGHGPGDARRPRIELHPGESIDIPLEGAHRIANEGDTDVVLIEVQHGTYFGEDDIVRLEDDFGRDRRRTIDDAHRRAAGGRPDLLVRVLPAEERQGARHAGPDHQRAPAARALVRLGHLPRRGRVAPAHVRPVSGMLHTTRLNPMAHLICVAHTRLELADILVALRKAGVENLMALGGDPPEDPSAGPGELAYAAELVELARAIGGFSIGVAAHPAGHPRSPHLQSDRDYLAAKLALADFGVTQFFFEASEYEGLVADLRERGIDTPVLPGILPVTSLSTMGRLGAMGAAAPAWMEDRLRAADERGGADAVRKEGVELATELCSHLLDVGVPGLHFYTFNTSSATREIYAALGLGPGAGS